MSDIYLAKIVGTEGFQKPLVIKKLLPQYSSKPSFVKRFLNEAKTLSRLNHSNLVHILDMGIIDGEYYIALEYIEGRNVAHIISKATKTGRLPSLGFVWHVVTQLGRGLAYAHKKKGESGESLMLVHQDINSFNVMVSYEAEVKIIDFGIAQIFLDKQTADGLPVAGKLLYFSPEQLQRKPVDRRVDIYGTGVLTYELLTGQRLVDHQETVQDTVKAILEMDVKAKVQGNVKIRDEVKPILIRAMAFDPEDRYAWMEEMLQDIRAVTKTCELDENPAEFSTYMNELFHREILLDRRRMRKLIAENLPARTEAAARRTVPVAAGRSIETGLVVARNLLASRWPFEEIAESLIAQGQHAPRTLSLSAGKSIFRQGEPGTEVYVIERGRVRIILQSGKIRQTIAILGPGDFFGESALV
ncbi:MAG: protein kinase, partial [Deltaproteobacteria bacterium]|nr:protein kinase [Deltaproteobacteria bacterium]